MNKKVIIISGFFNPIHQGHLELIKGATKLGHELIVIVNNDKQVALKKSCPFYNDIFRMELISRIRNVDKVYLSIDEDETIIKTLGKIIKDYVGTSSAYNHNDIRFIFANGGDRTVANEKEAIACETLGIEMMFGVGGGKVESSSKLIEKAVTWYHKQQQVLQYRQEEDKIYRVIKCYLKKPLKEGIDI